MMLKSFKAFGFEHLVTGVFPNARNPLLFHTYSKYIMENAPKLLCTGLEHLATNLVQACTLPTVKSCLSNLIQAIRKP